MCFKEGNQNKLRAYWDGGAKGQISVFMAIVFIGVLILTGILIDGTRIMSGKTQVKRALENSARSALASYNSRLKTDYGLFALGDLKGEILVENVKYYMNENLLIKGSSLNPGNITTKGLVDLYDFKVEEISVIPVLNFTRTDITKAQILEYMKYRVPGELIGDILDKAGVIKDMGKASKILKEKIVIDEKLGELEKNQQNLKFAISGTLGNVELDIEYNSDVLQMNKSIGDFNLDGARDLMVLDYVNLVEEYKVLGGFLRDMEEDLDLLEKKLLEYNMRIKELIDNGGEEGEIEDITYKKEGVLEELEGVRGDYCLINGLLSEKKNEITETYISIRGEHTESFIKPNEEGIKYGERIRAIILELGSNIKRLKEAIGDGCEDAEKKQDIVSDSIKNIILEELKKIEKIISNDRKIQEMVDAFKKNIDELKISIKALDYTTDTIVFGNGNDSFSNDNKELVKRSRYKILEMLMDVNSNYKIINYDYFLKKEKSEEKDPRKAIEDMSRDIIKKLVNDEINLLDEGINIEELPSRKKVTDNYFDEGVHIPSGEPVIKEIGYEGAVEKLEDEIEFSKNTATFPKKAFNFLSSIGDRLPEKIIKIRDDIYTTEYLISTFKNSVKIKNTKGQEGKIKRDSFFNGEIEYILHGHSSEKINILKTKGQILLVRFGINTLNLFMDSGKRQEAHAMATALTGWWSGGVGVPIVANLIICAWGMGGAINDLKDLDNGKSIPLIKTTNEEFIGNKLKLDYEDYLKIFLILKDSEKILGRAQDLIEINIKKIRPGFTMGTAYAGVRVETVVSMKYMFLTRFFTPSKFKNSEGRHIFRTVIYEVY